MNKRPFIYLGIVVLIAVVVFLIERPDLPKRGDVSDEPLFSHYDAKKITRIEVSQILSGVQLEKEGDRWLVADLVTPMRKELLEKEAKEYPEITWYPADISVIGTALGVFGDFPRGVVVSTNPDHQALYQVGPVGLSVKLYEDEKNVVDITIGKTSRDFTGNYVRVSDSNNVLISDRKLEGLFPTAVPDWRDHTIWRVDPKRVAAVEVRRPLGSYRLEKDDQGAWRMEKKKIKLDQEKATKLVERLAYLRAAGFASKEDPKVNFKSASLELTVELDDGQAMELEVAGSNNLKQQYARRPDDSQMYLVSNLNTSVPTNPKQLQQFP